MRSTCFRIFNQPSFVSGSIVQTREAQTLGPTFGRVWSRARTDLAFRRASWSPRSAMPPPGSSPCCSTSWSPEWSRRWCWKSSNSRILLQWKLFHQLRKSQENTFVGNFISIWHLYKSDTVWLLNERKEWLMIDWNHPRDLTWLRAREKSVFLVRKSCVLSNVSVAAVQVYSASPSVIYCVLFPDQLNKLSNVFLSLINSSTINGTTTPALLPECLVIIQLLRQLARKMPHNWL